MRKELPKAYNPKKVEDKIYKDWEKSGFFNPDKLPEKLCEKNAKTYTIILPPPNITDKLHIGHASIIATQDLMIRYHRMKGDRTLWLPGTDHAAIATQNVVEKKLLKEEGLSRHDLGREEFLKKVWGYLEKTQAVILNQTKKMGASLDWSREAFTLDEQRKKAVKKMFVDMYNAGAIYRGERIVNWCPRCHSTLADDEVEYKNQKTKLYTFKYSEDFPFAIATTRPETKLGDTAVAVNPKDKRYEKQIGKIYKIDFCGVKLKIKIIADRNVEMNFGTGALGVTPAHSMADWQMAEENGLEIIKVIGEDGKIKNNFGKYSGKSIKETREMIVKKLKKDNLLKKEEEIKNNLSICYRCSTPIEPLPSKQWFVSVNKKLKRLGGKSLKEKAIEVAKNKSIEFIPNRFEKRYLDWMKNMHDWCISRQIWFGHRIPVYYKSKIKSRKLKVGEEIYVGVKPPKEKGWIQDPDSLDTWFSSGMWTFSTLGWPDNFKNGKKSGDLKKFHPTQVLGTGYEILTLWVSRMIMMSLFAVNEIPFKKVYLNGMVLDEYGKKMSKSKGNGIDPLDMIDKFGTDAVRLSLLVGNTPGNDMRLSEEKIEGCRNFVNKLWNISRYIYQMSEVGGRKSEVGSRKIDIKKLTLADKWIVGELISTTKIIEQYLLRYEFSIAGEELKDFTWNKFADWYIESIKFSNGAEKEKILIIILTDLLKLWHPFIPFITEEIWKKFNDTDLIVENYPDSKKYNNEWVKFSEEGVNEKFKIIQNIVKSIRNARSKYKIGSSQKIDAVIYAKDKKELIESQKYLIKNLRTGISKLEILNKGAKIKDAIYLAAGNIEIYLIGTIDKKKEKENLQKEAGNLKKYLNQIKNKLDNKKFIANAPAEIIKTEKRKYEETKNRLKKLQNKL